MRVAVLLFAVAVLALITTTTPNSMLKLEISNKPKLPRKVKKATTDKQPTPSVSIIDSVEPWAAPTVVSDKADDKEEYPLLLTTASRLQRLGVAGAMVAIAITCRQ